MTYNASINLSLNDVISPVDDRLYGSFIEHMGRAVYTGIYEPTHALADEKGFRKDVARLIKPLKLPLIRYPGGNFVSGYRWEDGVGQDRPVRAELAWSAIEPNTFGTNEFMDFLRLVDSKAMLAVNLGTRGAQDAANLLEYCNFEGGTYFSELRKSHGYDKPHAVKLWCLGNEMDGPWQICAKTADEYGRAAAETAKMMKWLDPTIELVAAGSSFREMPTFGEWERTVLKHTYEHIEYLSLHTYYQNLDGDFPAFFANTTRMDSFINEVRGIVGEIKAQKETDKDVFLSFDEWNVWYHFKKENKEPPKWICPRPIEEERFNLADALLTGGMLITLINNCDIVKLACMAQLVNVIAPIMTQPGGEAYVQPTYYPFLYTSRYGRGTALRADIACPAYSAGGLENVPYIDAAAVADAGRVAVFILNKSLENDALIKLNLKGIKHSGRCLCISVEGDDLDAYNTASHKAVKPVSKIVSLDSGIALSRTSWNMIIIKAED